MSLSRIYYAWILFSLATSAAARYFRSQYVSENVSIPIADMLSKVSQDIQFETFFFASYVMLPVLLFAILKSSDFKRISQAGKALPMALFSLVAIAIVFYACFFVSQDHFRLGGGRFSLMLRVASSYWPLLAITFGSLLYIGCVFVGMLVISINKSARKQ